LWEGAALAYFKAIYGRVTEKTVTVRIPIQHLLLQVRREDSVSIPSNDWTVNNELEIMCKEAAVAYFKVPSRYSDGGTE
jgi:hypothetical protein